MKIKKPIALLLGVLMAIGALFSFSLTASAASSNITVDFIDTSWAHAAVPNLWNGDRIANETMEVMYTSSGDILYCIKPGVSLNGGDSMGVSNYLANLTTPSISSPGVVSTLLGTLYSFVDYSGTGLPTAATEGQYQYFAAQLLTWETVEGERDAGFNHVTLPSGYGQVLDLFKGSSIPSSVQNAVMNDYNQLVSNVQNALKVPSFMSQSASGAPVYQLAYNDNALSLTLNDTNNVLGNFSFSSNNPNVQMSVSGNTLTVTANSAFSENALITAAGKNGQSMGVVCYGDQAGALQPVVTTTSPTASPVTAYCNVKIAMGTITITKQDDKTGATPQGDASLNGAVFEILAADQATVVDTLYCGSGSSATSKEIPQGQYYYQEIAAPQGYTLNSTIYPIALNGTTASGSVNDTVIQGQIAVVKHTDQSDSSVNSSNSQVEQPLSGAVFDVYLKSAGSYDAAKAAEREQITTDENGYAQTGDLPYGVYTVEEISAPDGLKLVTPFDVSITQDGQVYRYILDDPTITEQVKIEKVDAESGQTIPVAGTAFKVKDMSTGDWVSQSFNYPTPTVIDTFVTAADGTLVMPENLKYGDYALVEV